ncbi:MAG: hypothetical protein R6V05_06945 [Candidatus Brocadiia bacterium]
MNKNKTRCPKCGSRNYQLHKDGDTIYVFKDGKCDHMEYLINSKEYWCLKCGYKWEKGGEKEMVPPEDDEDIEDFDDDEDDDE